MKILRKSGKIAILHCPKGGKKPDFSKAFTVAVDQVKQLDKYGHLVGKSMNSLANQDFRFSPLNKDDTVDGIKAASVELEAHLKDTNGTLRIKTYTFCNAGNSSFADDTFAVQNGSLKVFIEVCRARLESKVFFIMVYLFLASRVHNMSYAQGYTERLRPKVQPLTRCRPF